MAFAARNRIAFILGTLYVLLHYGVASKDNATKTLKENESWCGGKRIIHKSRGQLDIDLSVLLNDSTTNHVTPPFECNFKIRANTPISFQWYKFSKNFTGKYADCNQTSNFVKVWTGCQAHEEHCFTHYLQSNYELHSSDGCYDIKLSTNIKEKIFIANFKPVTYNTDQNTPYDDDTTSSFSNHLVFIIIGPIVFLIAVIGITFALMRQAQHRRLVDTLQVEQNLISQQTSTSSEAAQEECPNSPTSLLPKTDRQFSSDSKIRYSRQFSQQFQEGTTDHCYYPAKRISYISNRYSRGIPSEYRVSRVRCSRSYSAGESTMPRPSGEIARRSIAQRSPPHSGDWSKVQLVDVHSPQQPHQRHSSYHQQPLNLQSQQTGYQLQDQSYYQQPNFQQPAQHQHYHSQQLQHQPQQSSTSSQQQQQQQQSTTQPNTQSPQTSPTIQEEAPAYELVVGKELLSIDEDESQKPQQQTTHFIENPLEAHPDEFNLPEQQILVPLRDHEYEMKRLSHANRLSSLDSIFDNNLVICHENENFDRMEADTVLVRYDSSDSYFDNM